MSQVTDEILEKLKTLTLLEAAELVSQIEEAFGVSASSVTSGSLPPSGDNTVRSASPSTEKTTFDVVLESIRSDKRVAALKVVRSLTDLGLKEAKDFCSSLPKSVKEGVPKKEAELARKRLEEVGGKVSIK